MTPLESSINYTFTTPILLKQALTHKSYDENHNERLEFLGDSILDMVVTEYLYLHFPDAKEGRLTRMKSSLVRGTTLCEIAKELHLPNYLLLGKGEKKTNGKYNPAILEDTFEALIGAMFLDGGLATTKKAILYIFDSRLNAINQTLSLKDNKTKLQELLQQHRFSLPEYKLLNTEGKDHNAIFTVHASIENTNLECSKEGKTIKIAEQNCAAELLNSLQEYYLK